MHPFRKKRLADRGVLLEFDPQIDADELAAWRRRVEAGSRGAVLSGHHTLLLIGDDEVNVTSMDTNEVVAPRTVEITVSFREPYAIDLPLLLSESGLSQDRFLDELAALSLRARFLGFLPGFAYLEGLPRAWQLPRRSAPRPRVSAGTFAIAGAMAGIYPIDSPGGWNLLGRAEGRMWDPSRSRPNRVAAGDIVKIRPTFSLVEDAHGIADAPLDRDALVARVLSPGQLSLIVKRDEERLRFGLAAGGPMDRSAAREANRAAGNDAEEPVIEVALVGPELEMLVDALVVVVGDDGRPHPRELFRGERLEPLILRRRARGYIALRGGWSTRAARFSIEPYRLRRDDLLAGAEDATVSPAYRQQSDGKGTSLRVAEGVHGIDRDKLQRMVRQEWSVGDTSRRGVRLSAAQPILGAESQLPSTPLLFGSIQWHPDGSLTILGADHPITGGYVQPLILFESELSKVGRLRKGDLVTFDLSR